MDHTPALQKELDATGRLFLTDGTWNISGLEVTKDQTIDCQSPRTFIKTPSGEDTLVASKSIFRTEVYGGRWSGGRSLLRHSGSGAVQVLFSRMYVQDFEDAFHLGASVGSEWDRVQFQRCDYGIHHTGDGAFNTNEIRGCKFLDSKDTYTGVGVSVGENSAHGNSMFGCWFEHLDKAVELRGGINRWAMYSPYFEDNTSTLVAHTDPGLGRNRAVHILDGYWGNSDQALPHVIARGWSDVTLTRGGARIRDDQPMLHTDSVYTCVVDSVNYHFVGSGPNPALGCLVTGSGLCAHTASPNNHKVD